MLFNKVISEQSNILELPTNKTELKVEIKAMASIAYSIVTAKHKGPIRLNIAFLPRCEGDLICIVGKDKDNMSEDNCILRFVDRQKMMLYPRVAFDPKQVLNTQFLNGPPDKRVWQPDYLYLQISSNSGCQFSLTAVFTDEEEEAAKKAKAGQATPQHKAKFMVRDLVTSKVGELKEQRDGLRKAQYEEKFMKHLAKKRRDAQSPFGGSSKDFLAIHENTLPNWKEHSILK